MENIQELATSVRERIEMLKEKSNLEGEELAFLHARSAYLTEEEKERLFPVVKVVKKVVKKK